MKSPKENRKSDQESEKKMKAIMELRETRRKHKANLCRRRQVKRKMADGRGKGRRRKGESADERNGRERRGKNNVRKSLEQTEN